MNSIKEDISTTLTIVSCVIGAGFVSGKELIILLGSSHTIVNSIIFAFLYGVAVYSIMSYCKHNNINTVQQWSHHLAGRYHKSITLLLLICYLAMTVTMLATINETMCYVLNLNSNIPIFSCAVAIAVAIFLYQGARGLQLLCSASVPLVIVAIIVCLANNIDSMQLSTDIPNITQCASYAIFNSVMSVGVVAPLSRSNHKCRVSIAVALILCILIAVILAVMDNYPTNTYNIPLLSLATNGYYLSLYTICLLLSATVSVATNCYILSSWADDITHDRSISIGIVLTLSLILSLLQLDIILVILYPMVTVIGIIMLILIAKKHTTR